MGGASVPLGTGRSWRQEHPRGSPASRAVLGRPRAARGPAGGRELTDANGNGLDHEITLLRQKAYHAITPACPDGTELIGIGFDDQSREDSLAGIDGASGWAPSTLIERRCRYANDGTELSIYVFVNNPELAARMRWALAQVQALSPERRREAEATDRLMTLASGELAIVARSHEPSERFSAQTLLRDGLLVQCELRERTSDYDENTRRLRACLDNVDAAFLRETLAGHGVFETDATGTIVGRR